MRTTRPCCASTWKSSSGWPTRPARIALNWVGVTVDTDSVMVYQEAPQTPIDKVEAIHDAVLIDFLPDQVNTVNFKVGGSLRTFAFNTGRSETPVR
jgi:hypothetical protein